MEIKRATKRASWIATLILFHLLCISGGLAVETSPSGELNQAESGGEWAVRLPDTGNIPHTAPDWGGSLAALTWRLYELYGDRRILQANYQSMRRYVDFLEIKCTNGVLRGYGGKWDFIGDWVPPGRGMDTTNWSAQPAAEMFNNCCRVHLWEILAKSAAVLGDQAEVARCQIALAAMRPAIHETFFDATNHRYGIDEQAYQFMPLLVGDVTWVKAHHAAMPGRIVSKWKRAGQKFTMDVRIPANTTATVFVPAKNAEVVTESDQSASKAAGVTFLRIENNAAVYAVGSGTYRFQSTLTEDMR